MTQVPETLPPTDPEPQATAIPAPASETVPPEFPPRRTEPTRYGDWEKAGRCIDF